MSNKGLRAGPCGRLRRRFATYPPKQSFFGASPLRLGLRGYRSLTQANRFLERPLRGLIVAAGRRGLRPLPLGWGRGVRSMWRNVSGAFVAHRSLFLTQRYAKPRREIPLLHLYNSTRLKPIGSPSLRPLRETPPPTFSTANTVRGRGWVSVERGVVSVEFSWVSVESNCAFYPEPAYFLQLIAFFRKNSTETLRFRVLKKGVNAFIFAQTQ